MHSAAAATCRTTEENSSVRQKNRISHFSDILIAHLLAIYHSNDFPQEKCTKNSHLEFTPAQKKCHIKMWHAIYFLRNFRKKLKTWQTENLTVYAFVGVLLHSSKKLRHERRRLHRQEKSRRRRLPRIAIQLLFVKKQFYTWRPSAASRRTDLCPASKRCHGRAYLQSERGFSPLMIRPLFQLSSPILQTR